MYFVWGLWRAHRHQPHTHLHTHVDGAVHLHEHVHAQGHVHIHAAEGKPSSLTPRALFILFVLGPCEALIPLLMVPAAKSLLAGAVLVAGIFGAVTITTMLAVVAVAFAGLGRFSVGFSGPPLCPRPGRRALVVSGLLIVQPGW